MKDSINFLDHINGRKRESFQDTLDRAVSRIAIGGLGCG